MKERGTLSLILVSVALVVVGVGCFGVPLFE